MSRTFQSFVGVDLHKCTVTLAAVDPAGETNRRSRSAPRASTRSNVVAALARPCHWRSRPVRSSNGSSNAFDRCVDRIDIADATELANRRGKRRKNDRNDALDIARDWRAASARWVSSPTRS